MSKEATRRYRARQRGEDVPKLSAGAPKGYKQTEEHIQKRKRFGVNHHAFKGEDIVIKSGRTRALRRYSRKPCEICGSPKAERHHKDDNTANNTPGNIRFLCRRCHMLEDGRLDGLRIIARKNQPKAVAARWGKVVLL